MLIGTKNYIIKFTYPRRRGLGSEDHERYYSLLERFEPIETIFKRINYGFLYNSNAVNDDRNITSSGWKIPLIDDWNELTSYLITEYLDVTESNISKHLKSKKSVDSPLGWSYNTKPHPRWDADATHYGLDTFGLNILPAGWIKFDDDFNYSGARAYFWLKNQTTGTPPKNYSIRFNSNTGTIANPISYNDNYGFSVRCFRELTTDEMKQHNDGDLLDGTQMDEYVGNDGLKYRTVKIGEQVWLSENLCETRFRNGDAIPDLFLAEDWDQETMPGRCYVLNERTFSLYPENDIVEFEKITMNDFFNLSEVEYGVRLVAFLNHYNSNNYFLISKEGDKQSLVSASF